MSFLPVGQHPEQADIGVSRDGPGHVKGQRNAGDRGPCRESGCDVEADQAPAYIATAGLTGEEPLPGPVVALVAQRFIEGVVSACAQRLI